MGHHVQVSQSEVSADRFVAFARDPSQGMEVAFEADRWVLRPSPDFLAALASLRAIRGLKVSAS